jgi:hypothetical protein
LNVYAGALDKCWIDRVVAHLAPGGRVNELDLLSSDQADEERSEEEQPHLEGQQKLRIVTG